MTPISSLTARIMKRWARGLITVAVLSLIAAFAGIAGADTPKAAGSDTQGLNKVAIPNFDPDTWKPTQEQPLPTMESPITFQLTDDGGYWFDHQNKDLEKVLHSRSLGAGAGPTTVKFSIKPEFTEEAHVVNSIIWPQGARNMPFEQPGGVTGDLTVDLINPGLYAFQCTIHPYMLGAVVIDDPGTPGADFGQKLHWIDGTVMPSAAHEVLSIVRSFFVLTEPGNWQGYAADKDTTWDPGYPRAPILTYNEDGSPFFIPNLDDHYQKMFKEPVTLKAPQKPTEPGVGTAYAMTQWEMSAGKTKPGSISAWDTETWKMKSKWFAPSVNLNNPHNVWTSLDGKLLYSTNWFSNNLTVFDRETGAVLREVEIGPSPSHVITRSTTDTIIIPNNGGGRISEVDAGGYKVIRTYLTQAPGEKPAFPHGHWVSADGKRVVTPNSNETGASIVDMDMRSMMKPKTGLHPVAASFTNDGKRAYVANLLEHTLTCVSVEEPACPTPSGDVKPTYNIDLRANYNKITGESKGPYGLSPIQLPAAPNDNYLLTVGTFTSNILVIDLKNNKFVKTLPCGPGCHGINFGAKKGGGYYAYVTIKFANKFIVVDGDPNGDGNPDDAKVAGELVTDAEPSIQMDDKPTLNIGQGGNGVFIYPIAYNGWVQKMPDAWKAQLTCQQREPLSKALC